MLSDYFQTSSTWGGDAPVNISAARPVERVNLLHLDQNGPMFDAPTATGAAAESHGIGASPQVQSAKRSRRGRQGSTTADHGDDGGDGKDWVEYVDADGSFAAALGFEERVSGAPLGVGGSYLNVPPLAPPLSPAELMTMLKACSGDARDLLKVLNIVPGDPNVEEQLQLALTCRARLIVAYFRQRLVEVPDSGRAGSACDGEGAKTESREPSKKRLVRMDEAMPALFYKLDRRLDLRDGLVTMWYPVDEAGAAITKVSVQGAMGAEESEGGGGSKHRLKGHVPPPRQLHGTWSAVPVLVPIEDSPYAPTRQVDRKLWSAAEKGNSAEAEAALSSGARINSFAHNIGSWSALHLAAYKGHVDVIRCLLAHDANVSLPDVVGYMPLHTAAANGQSAAVDALVRQGASVEAVSDDLDTPLHLAAASGHLETATRLVTLGASVFKRNAALRTPSEVAEAMLRQYDQRRELEDRNESSASPLPKADAIRRWRARMSQLAHLLSPAQDGGWGVFHPQSADRCVFVGGIPWKWQEREVRELFEECGTIEEIVLGPPSIPALPGHSVDRCAALHRNGL